MSSVQREGIIKNGIGMWKRQLSQWGSKMVEGWRSVPLTPLVVDVSIICGLKEYSKKTKLHLKVAELY